MPEPQQVDQTPDFIPASAPDTPDFIPVIPATAPQSASTPDFIPADPNVKPSDGTGWLATIANGVKNVGYNSVIRPFAQAPQFGSDIIHGNVGGIQNDLRKNIGAAIMPWADADTSTEATANPGISTGKGAWD